MTPRHGVATFNVLDADSPRFVDWTVRSIYSSWLSLPVSISVFTHPRYRRGQQEFFPGGICRSSLSKSCFSYQHNLNHVSNHIHFQSSRLSSQFLDFQSVTPNQYPPSVSIPPSVSCTLQKHINSYTVHRNREILLPKSPCLTCKTAKLEMFEMAFRHAAHLLSSEGPLSFD